MRAYNSEKIKKDIYIKGYSYHLNKKILIEIIKDTLRFEGGVNDLERKTDSLDKLLENREKELQTFWGID